MQLVSLPEVSLQVRILTITSLSISPGWFTNARLVMLGSIAAGLQGVVGDGIDGILFDMCENAGAGGAALVVVNCAVKAAGLALICWGVAVAFFEHM